jgi:hypothetical protein
LTRKAPYKFESISLQRGVRCETDLLDLATAKDHDFGYAKGNFMIELTSRLIGSSFCAVAD